MGRTLYHASYSLPHCKGQSTWRKKKVVTALFLDVKGAFPSVDINRLKHDMRVRGIPKELTTWIARRMVNRETSLNFDDYTSDPFTVENGLDQGDPFSVIGYILYNSDILNTPNTADGEDSIFLLMTQRFSLKVQTMWKLIRR